jgi:hypothetical protein
MNKITMTAIAFALGLAPWSAQAEPTLNLNVCEKLVEDLFIPPTFSEMRSCNKPSKIAGKIAYCAALPHCCVPGVCLTDPLCYTLKKVQTVEGYWKHRGDIYCSTKGITPRDLLTKILMDQIANAADLLTGTTLDLAINVVAADSDSMYYRAKSVPSVWKEYVKALVAPIYDGGASGFNHSDLDGMRIISSSDWNGQMYLQGAANAITLGQLVVVKSSIYDLIMNQTISSSLYDNDRLNAVEVLIHELVHVKQYRTLGRTRFLKEYIFQNMLNLFKYCQDSFEKEAYSYGARVAQTWDGPYCKATKTQHNDKIKECGLSLDLLTCSQSAGVCALGQTGCKRSPAVVHRVALNCDGSKLSNSQVQDISLSSGYRNYTCANSHRAHCIDDGSFDIYYSEWCDYAGPTCKEISPKEYACDPGARPSGSCQVKTVHRTDLNCAGDITVSEHSIDVIKSGYRDYTCGNRFFEMCVADSSWDFYQAEWCDYACQ